MCVCVCVCTCMYMYVCVYIWIHILYAWKQKKGLGVEMALVPTNWSTLLGDMVDRMLFDVAVGGIIDSLHDVCFVWCVCRCHVFWYDFVVLCCIWFWAFFLLRGGQRERERERERALLETIAIQKAIWRCRGRCDWFEFFFMIGRILSLNVSEWWTEFCFFKRKKVFLECFLIIDRWCLCLFSKW